MKCIKCTEQNINKANYCKKCGYEFSEKERKAAKSKTLTGKLEIAEKAYKYGTLKVITDHIIFKIASVLIILGVGLYFSIKDSNNLELLESKNYKIEYNTQTKEYYLITKQNSIPIDLYIPKKNEEITITHLDNNKELSKETFTVGDEIYLDINGQEDYYIIEDETSKLVIYVFLDNAEDSNE